MYIAQPLLWGSVGALALWNRQRGEARLAMLSDPWLIGGAALVGLLQVVLLFLAGFLTGFGNSPYSRQPMFVALNLWFVVTRLAGLELARWQLINAFGRRKVLIGGTAVWLLLTLAGLPLHAFTSLSADQHTLDFLGGIVVPLAGQNLLATYLSAVGGPLASIAYMGTLQIAEWVPPILPKLPWTLALFLGVMVPAVGLFVLRDLKAWLTDDTAAEKTEEPSDWGINTVWVAVGALVVFMVWFNTGAFGVRPSVVSGQSMQPNLYLGDVVVVRQVPVTDLKIGDVVQFQRGNLSVIHRVKAIQTSGGKAMFITRGDNNNVDDAPVEASQVNGKMVAVIPKVGWIGIGVKSLFGLVR
jgi:signal peptidase I